ncbi:MAG: XRE family transcriptional regulator [Campylobacterales bacterium]|nr:XRE family transcriptional regulator [Campylobacterales bacterium]
MPHNFSEQLHKSIGKNVSRIRRSKKISQLKLAYALGYKSVSPISSAEIYYNHIHFNVEQLVKIAYVLECEVCDFFDSKEIMKKG